jgi:quinoprotein glucose dehydrogenase
MTPKATTNLTMATLAMVVGLTAIAAKAQQTNTQSDVTYTAAQAKRGDTLYQDQCAPCHGADLTGGEGAPPIAGGGFNAEWDGLPIGQLFERVRATMPANDPGTLSPQQTADLAALILSKANVPAGAKELPSQVELLNQMTFKAPK